jgi:hypothetical protein
VAGEGAADPDLPAPDVSPRQHLDRALLSRRPEHPGAPPRPLEGASEHGRGFGLLTENSDRIENEEEP